MATSKPRVTVVLDQETNAIIREFCELSGISVSAFISQSMAKASSTLEQVIPLLKVAKSMDDHATAMASHILGDAKADLSAISRTLDIDIQDLSEYLGASPEHAGVAPAARVSGDSLPPYINKGVNSNRVSTENPLGTVHYIGKSALSSKQDKGV